MTTTFTRHTIDTAPQGSQALLQDTKKAWGFLPQLHATLAEAPVALNAYTTLFGLVAQSSLSPQEQQVAYLTVSVLHGCEYCVGGHTYLARSVKLPEPVVQSVREGRSIIGEARLAALRDFVEAVVRERGMAGDAAVEAFLAAGYTRANVLELVTLVATKVISNYVNHLAHVPVEDFIRNEPSLNWVAPARRAAQRATA
jgi:AhpD family alkylhydroperoxidase